MTKLEPKCRRTVIYSSDSKVKVVAETTGRPPDVGPAASQPSGVVRNRAITLHILPGYTKQRNLFNANLQESLQDMASENVKNFDFI